MTVINNMHARAIGPGAGRILESSCVYVFLRVIERSILCRREADIDDDDDLDIHEINNIY